MRALETICWVEPPHASKQGDHVYRTAQPCEALAKAGQLRVVSGSSACARILACAEVADLLVLCDSTDHRWPSLVKRRTKRGLRTIFEINDQFLALQEWNPTAGFFRSQDHRALTLEIASLCDGLQFTNDELAQRFGMVNDNHRSFWNQLADCPKTLAEKPGEVVIGWAGSWGHLKDLESILPILEEVAAEHPEVSFAFMGDPRFEALWQHWDPKRVRFQPGGDLQSYLLFLDSLTIGIAPLRDTEFNRCRSDVKFLEYASRGVVALLADLPPYDIPIHRESVALGFDSLDSLRKQLQNLLSDPELLESLKNRAYQYVLSKRLELPNAERRLQWYGRLNFESDAQAREAFNKLWQMMDSDPMDRFADDQYRRLELVDQDRLILDALLLAQRKQLDELKALEAHEIPRIGLVMAMAGLEDDWEKVVSQNEDPLAYRKAAHLALGNGEFQVAEHFLRLGLERYEGDTGLRLGFVELLLARGNAPEAIEFCRSILAENRFAYPARDRLAYLLLQAGEKEEAIRLLKLQDKEPDPSLAGQLLLAEILSADGLLAEALDVVEHYPGYQHLSGPGELEWLKALARHALANDALETARDAMARLKLLMGEPTA